MADMNSQTDDLFRVKKSMKGPPGEIPQCNRVLEILDETPVVEEVSGKAEIEFHGASENVTYAYDDESLISTILQNKNDLSKQVVFVLSLIYTIDATCQ